jgi:ribulose-bisphosphate carboxylase small chain
MKLTQGAFSFLPDLSDDQILRQVRYALDKSWALSIEYTQDPHPRNAYWMMWGLPLFDVKDEGVILLEINRCRKSEPDSYVRLVAFDNSRGTESAVLSFIVNRPSYEPGFRLVRQELAGRCISYTLESYAVSKQPIGLRYLL